MSKGDTTELVSTLIDAIRIECEPVPNVEARAHRWKMFAEALESYVDGRISDRAAENRFFADQDDR